MLGTIRVRAYLFSIFIVSCAVLTILVITCLFTDVEKKTNQLLTLDCNVYGIQLEVKSLSQNFRQYSVDRSLESDIRQSADNLDKDIKNLRDDVFSYGYVREIDDLYNMIQTFVEQISIALESPGEFETIAEYSNQIAYISSLIVCYYDYVYTAMQKYYGSVRASLSKRVILLYVIVVAAVVLFLLATFFVISWLKHSLLIPFDRMTRKAENFRSDGPSHLDRSQDEVVLLESTFDSMMDRVQHQIDNNEVRMKMELDLKQQKLEKARMERLLSETETRVLRACITPHFLYNTLNIIAQMAYIENAEKTERLIESVSDYLRYNLSDFHELSTFAQEIQNIKDYTYIQKMRFGDRFCFDIESDGSADSVPVPTMVLQPIVENSIVHGFGSGTTGGMIKISVVKNGDRVEFSVTDNGCGINPDVIEEIMTQYKAPNRISTHVQSLGLQNVINRLLACFHEKLVMHIDSVPNVETKLSFSVPILDNSLMEKISDNEIGSEEEI